MTDDAVLPGERVHPGSTALLVVDVQNDFAAPGGWFDRNGQDLKYMHQAIDRLESFLGAARATGVPIVFVQAIYDEKWLSSPMLERHRLTGLDTRHCMEGTWGADFFQIGPEPGEEVIIKHRYSAFFNTGLDSLLRARGIVNVIVAGITTNVCVESTAREAYMRDYHVVTVEDCSATYSAEAHEASLQNLRRAFGRVVSARAIEERWLEQT